MEFVGQSNPLDFIGNLSRTKTPTLAAETSNITSFEHTISPLQGPFVAQTPSL